MVKYKLPVSSQVLIAILVSQEVLNGEAYLSQLKVPEDVFLGEAAVTVKEGVCYIMIVNITQEPVNIIIPAQDLDPFMMERSENSFDADSYNENVQKLSNKQRIREIQSRSRKQYHNEAEYKQIKKITD